jgi:virulence factor Mce-like protein
VRRLLATALVLAACGVFWLLGAGAGGDGQGGTEFKVELDNAFGLIEGADLKIAGVRAGKITSLAVDRRTHRALVGFKVTRNGFGSLRTDATCESRPQSLIGEYFLDCQPGTAATKLRDGATIAVTRTSSTVAPDLVNDILRRPYRERLAIILSELGAGVAGNARNLDDAIRRASPALRETDKVLATLARQNRILADLATNADKVVGDLAANRRDVGRWVDEAGRTAQLSAERKADIAAGFRKLPGFLEQLRPAMAALGQTAEAQTPALANLRRSAKGLTELFQRLAPFSQASQPAFKALGQASAVGTKAVKAAVPVVDELNRFAAGTPELGNNLAMVLEHLDDPSHYVEDDPRAARLTGRARPTGYSGLEALLAYVFDQANSTNIYDRNGHILKVAPYLNDCADYADVQVAKKPDIAARCSAALGPNQPGLNFPDPTKPDGAGDARRVPTKRILGDSVPETRPLPAAAPVATPQPEAPKPPVLDLSPIVPGLPPITLPDVIGMLGGALTGEANGGAAGRDGADKTALLDYLLGR